MKNFKTISIIIIVIALLAVVKIMFLSPKDAGKSAGPASGAPAQASPVTVYVAVTENINNKVFASGTILANEEVVLMPEMGGKIISMNINEGSHVNKGELLVKMADADLQAQSKKLQVQIKLAEEKEGRQKQLLGISGISQEEYDISLNQLNSIKADVEFNKAQIAKTEIRAPFNGMIGLKHVSEGS